MSRKPKLGGIIFGLLTVFFVLAALLYRQEITDWFKFLSYKPSQAIVQLADDSGMSQSGRFYFYITDPKLESASNFNKDCRRSESINPVLGCYVGGSDKIYIYDIDNADLQGVEEVTAAHEMLHAAYFRLSNDERDRIGKLLDKEYERIKTPELEKRMSYYEKEEPGGQAVELFAILPTEFSDIGSELDTYYKKYFDDRQKVVSLYKKYQKAFTDIETQINELSANLNSQHQAISEAETNFNISVSNLNSQINSFNNRAASGGFVSQSQFDFEREQLVAQHASLLNREAEIEKMIIEYNDGVSRLSELGGQMDKLTKSINSVEEVN